MRKAEWGMRNESCSSFRIPHFGDTLMTLRKPSCVALLLCAAALPARAADPYSIKPVTEAAPKELAEPVRKLMGDRAVRLLDAKGEALAQVWFRKDVPAKAQSGGELTYQQVPESTVVGALKVL